MNWSIFSLIDQFIVVECDCYYNGTRNDACLPRNDACPCKYNFAGKYCNECRAGFFNFPSCTRKSMK